MSNLKRSFFWAAFYFAAIMLLALFDYQSTPIIDFAIYFYFAAIVAVPVTIFFPSIVKVNVFIPIAVWGCIYLVLLQTVDRTASSPAGSFAIILLEFILVEAGVWLGYQVAAGISHAESLMDALALSAFPSKTHDIEQENQRIKIEFTRSRRYHRPLSLVILEPQEMGEMTSKEMLRSVQHDLMSRFTTARIGQIIEDRVRQTDLLLRDHRGRFILLCPETDLKSATSMAERMTQAIKERANMQALCGVASFPEDALTFDDLMDTARARLTRSTFVPTNEQAVVFNSN